MTSPYERERIENWVSDFCGSDEGRRLGAAASEWGPSVLVEVLVRAVDHRGRSADELEEEDVRAGLLGAASLELPDSVRAAVPDWTARLLTGLQDEGRLAGGRLLGSFARAFRDSYLEEASGKPKPVVRAGARIGRNDPCPCGSGKKYKRCCLNASS